MSSIHGQHPEHEQRRAQFGLQDGGRGWNGGWRGRGSGCQWASQWASGGGGIDDQRAHRGALRRQTPLAPQAAPAGGERLAERIVAAGIEHQDGDAGLTLDLHRLETKVAFVVDLGLHGHEPVLAAELQRVARVEEQRRVGAGGALAKTAGRGFQRGAVRVRDRFHIEPNPRRRRRQSLGVIQRVGEGSDVLIGAHANDQRDTGGDLRGPGGEAGHGHRQQQENRAEHAPDVPLRIREGAYESCCRVSTGCWAGKRAERQALAPRPWA